MYTARKRYISTIILVLWFLSSILNISVVHAAIGDIGHWRDSVWGQIPGTGFGAFEFDTELRNDGIYTKPNNGTIQLNEAGDYLVIATTHDNDDSNWRYNSQLRVDQTAGTWDIFTSHYSWYSRDNSEDESWTRAVSVIIWASANSQIQVQKRRDTDAPTSGSIVNASDVQVIRLSQSNYGIYGIGGTWNAYWGTTPNTIDIDSVVSQSDISAIEWNTAWDTITLKGDNKKYLVAWSVSFNSGAWRSQRIGHLEYDNVDSLSTRAYCYQRNAANEYCGLGSMDVIETNTADISVQAEVFRGPWVAADDGGADQDGNMITDGNGQMIILEMPDYLEVFRSEDSVGLQDITTAQTLNIARDVNISDSLSFTKNSDSLVNVTNPADIFSWANIWTARNNVASWSRQTTFGSIAIDGVEQTLGRHWNYSRWNQGTTDTFAMSIHPAGIYTTSGPWSTIWINSTPLTWWEPGWNDRTQPGTLGFFALNLDTFVAPESDQSAYRFFSNIDSTEVGTVLAAQNTAATLASDGDAFRLRTLMSITQNKLRQNEKDFKLQFALKSGTCDISFTGETYSDVTASSAIAFNNNASVADETNLTANANDPTNGFTTVNQTYQELNNFTNSVAPILEDQNWKWDFSLIDNSAPDNTSYCFRIVESDGTLLDSYSTIPEITTAAAPVWPIAPGWVSTDLNLWLKSNAGTSTTTNNANLTTWNDQSWNGKNATAVTAPTFRNNTTDNLNFYPTVNFNGSNQSMRNTTWGMSSKSYFAVVVPTNTVDGTAAGWVPFGLHCLNTTVTPGTCGLPFGWMVLWAFTATIPDEVITHWLGSSANYRSAETGSDSYSAWKPMLVMMNEDAAGTKTNIYEKGVQLDNFTFNTYQSVTNTNYSLWSSLDATYPFYFNGKIAEVINFNNRLSDANRIKIESYLSLKYGITLKNGTQDYIASDWATIMWNATNAGSFNKDIFGIGRDILQGLTQVQSKSVNEESVITIQAVGEWTNIAPSFIDISDKEFLTIWNNGDSNTWSSVDVPIGFFTLSRRWKAQETWEVGSINLDFDIANTDFDIPIPSTGTNYYFIQDSNNNGNLADETPTVMTNLWWNLWRAAGVNINDNQIFTIATLASTNNIPTNITLSNNNINENVAANSVIGTLSTTDADFLDTHTYSLVSGIGDTDNTFFTISGNTLRLIHSPDYEIKNSYSLRIQTNDGNGWVYQKIFTVSINNIWEWVSTSIDFENILNDYKYTVTSGNWLRSTTNPHTGTHSFESDIAGINNTQACFEVTHNSSTEWSIDFYYNVSSQAGWDFLRFYIDNVEQWAGWSGTVPWTQYTSASVSAGSHLYRWCYIKNWNTAAGLDSAFIDDITFTSTATDTTPPTIDSTNFASGSLLPGWNHDIIINYSDADSGIDSSSTIMQLYKWDWVSAYGSDIAWSGITFNSVSTSSASYSTNNLTFGKYQYRFSISDNDGNPVVYVHDFYIDQPEFIVWSGSIDIGSLSSLSNTFSDTVTITVKTVWAAFDVTMDRSSAFTQWVEEIPSYNGTLWYGYQQTPYAWDISSILTNQNIATQAALINTNGNKNTYTYDIQIWALIDLEQAAWDYMWNLDFGINLTY